MDLLLHLRKSLAADFFSPAGYFFWGWVLLYVSVGTLLNILKQRRSGKTSLSLFQALKDCFPKKTFWGPSAKLDYQILLLCHYLISYPVGFFLASQGKVAASIAPQVTKWLSVFGTVHIPISNGFWVDAIYTLLVLIAADLGWTVQHIIFHRVPKLWEFHKVHHSATELNIFTIARLHPVDVLSQAWFAGLSMGIFIGFSKAFLGYSPSLVLFMNVSWAMACFRILGIYRHSPIWISFGPTLSTVFCSPAMHQIHHSTEKRHYDRNFSTVFSFWDFVFGTLYIPKEREKLRFGIQADPRGSRNYDSLLGCLLYPFLSDKLLSRFFPIRRFEHDKVQKSSNPGSE